MKDNPGLGVLFILLMVSIMGLMVVTVQNGQAGEDSYKKTMMGIFGGEHQLQKLIEKKELGIRLSWKGNSGEYISSSLPHHKIRVILDDGITMPTITFHWRPFGRIMIMTNHVPLVEELIEEWIDYATVRIRSSDWSMQVKIY